MTYTVISPNASQSPGLFPAQANVNFQRLLDIINNDHLFVNTTQANQGTHRQAQFINRAVPGSLTAGTDGVLYSALDKASNSQLFWYNGGSNVQVSGGQVLIDQGQVNITNTPINLTLVPDNSFGYFYFWNTITPNFTQIVYWQSIAGAVTFSYGVATISNTVPPTAFYSVTMSAVGLQVKGQRYSLAAQGTYNYRTFLVP